MKAITVKEIKLISIESFLPSAVDGIIIGSQKEISLESREKEERPSRSQLLYVLILQWNRPLSSHHMKARKGVSRFSFDRILSDHQKQSKKKQKSSERSAMWFDIAFWISMNPLTDRSDLQLSTFCCPCIIFFGITVWCINPVDFFFFSYNGQEFCAILKHHRT